MFFILFVHRNGDVKKSNAEWKSNLKLPPKDMRIRTAVSSFILSQFFLQMINTKSSVSPNISQSANTFKLCIKTIHMPLLLIHATITSSIVTRQIMTEFAGEAFCLRLLRNTVYLLFKNVHCTEFLKFSGNIGHFNSKIMFKFCENKMYA